MTASSTEERIKAVWKTLLKVDEIAPEQSFFEAGGNSLLMIDMLFQLGGDMGLEIDPGLLFEDPTLKGFSALIEASRKSENTVVSGII